jgi:formylglycine-generating enzyme required for sulfatase activity
MTNMTPEQILGLLQSLPAEERAKIVAQLQTGGVNLGVNNAIAQMGDAVAGDKVLGDKHEHHHGDPAVGRERIAAERGYLTGLITRCNRLSLSDADANDPTRGAVQLDAIYADLEVASTVELPKNSKQFNRKRERQRTALEALAGPSPLVLLGAPGSGKSSVVNFVTVCLARASCGEPGWLERLGAEWPHGVRLPVPLLLREFGAWVNALDAAPPRGELSLLWRWLSTHLPDDLALIRTAVYEGHALLLLDGLDEVPRGPQGQTLRLVRETIQALALGTTSRVVVTCRTLDYARKERQLATWASETVIALNADLRARFVTTWFGALATVGRFAAQRASQLSAGLTQQIAARAELRRLAGSPLLLTMMTLVQAEDGELPDTRVMLYERCLKELLQKWRRDQRDQTLAQALDLPQWREDDLDALMNYLGYAAHQRGVSGDGEQGSDLPEPVIKQIAAAFFASYDQDGEPKRRDARAEAFVHHISRYSNGLLQPHDDGASAGATIYRFPHRTFQEYLAARRLTSDDGWSDDMSEFADRGLAHADAGSQWREALLLAVSKLARGGQLRPAADLVEVLLDAGLTHAPLAGELLAEIGKERLGRLRQRSAQLWQRGVAAQLAVLDSAEQPIDARLRAGFALGRLDDPRYPVTLAQWQAEWVTRKEIFGQPKGYFCYVPGGTYTIGGWEGGEQSVDLTLAPFWIGRLPVTVAQYTAFVDDPHGYRADRWWTAAGLQWRGERTAPVYWDNPRFNSANQPVVGVTWYEAMAYCAWVSAQLGADVRLPTEAEWEAAAAFAGPTEWREYPWGDQPEPTLAHALFDEATLDRTPPVGCCPAGAAACGALDMVGTVWEWCISRYDAYPDGAGQRMERFTNGDFDVPLRGGSAWDDSTNVRCGARIRYYSYYGGSYGFRVVVPLVRTDVLFSGS